MEEIIKPIYRGIEERFVKIACAAKCRNLRNKYEALHTDVMTSRIADIESISLKRDLMTEIENELFAGDIAPHTTEEAVDFAKRALLELGDSFTSEAEIKAIVPEHL